MQIAMTKTAKCGDEIYHTGEQKFSPLGIALAWIGRATAQNRETSGATLPLRMCTIVKGTCAVRSCNVAKHNCRSACLVHLTRASHVHKCAQNCRSEGGSVDARIKYFRHSCCFVQFNCCTGFILRNRSVFQVELLTLTPLL